jgi:hypothetical protein
MCTICQNRANELSIRCLVSRVVNQPKFLVVCGLCGKNSLAGMSMGCLLQCPWVLLLTASTFLFRTIREEVSFEQPLINVI